MHVRMKTRYAGPSGTCEPGKAINLPPQEAKSLIEAGYAEKLDDGSGSQVETAAKRTRPPKGRRGN